jgi:uncharacterized metal-binding protein YceD (DUF177 family)
MKPQREFEIAFVGLKSGEHEFNYDIDDKFFASFAPQDFSDSHLHVRLLLDKKNRFFLLKFIITGEVTVNCDRCGDPFVLPVWDEFDLVVRMVEDPAAVEDDEDPNVAYIALHESLLQVSEWVYEFARLCIPMQRVHPDNSQGESGCNKKALKMLEEMQHRVQEKKNPIWKDLDKFREN